MATAPKWLKLRTSNLTCTFPRAVWTRPLKNFSNGGICKNSLGRYMHCHERLPVTGSGGGGGTDLRPPELDVVLAAVQQQ